MKLLQNSLVVGGMTLISRLLGFVREMLMAMVLGSGPMASAFVVAFRFPNLFRRWFAEGAFNAAFVPLYAGTLEEKGQEQADAFAREALSTLFFALMVLMLASELAMPWIMRALAPGFLRDPALFAKTVLFAQITTPYIVFMSLTAMLGGILNAHMRFAAAAAAPVILNIVLVAVLLSAPADPATAALRLSIGVSFSGVLQVLAVYLGCRRLGIDLRLRRPRMTPGVRRLLALGVPGAIAAGVVQINLVVGQIFASFQDGAVAWLYYADRLYQLPLGVVGIAMGVALLPGLTRQVRASDESGAARSLNEALILSAALTLPAAIALAVLPVYFIEGLFMRGAFTHADALATGHALMAYAAGLPAFILIKVFAPGYFAREDTATPMRLAALSMGVNVTLGAVLFFTIGFVGLAIATSVAGWVNAVGLGAGLWRQGRFVPDRALASRLLRLLVAAVLMGVVIAILAGPVRMALQGLPAHNFTSAVLMALTGLLVYAPLALLTRALRWREVSALIRRS